MEYPGCANEIKLLVTSHISRLQSTRTAQEAIFWADQANSPPPSTDADKETTKVHFRFTESGSRMVMTISVYEVTTLCCWDIWSTNFVMTIST